MGWVRRMGVRRRGRGEEDGDGRNRIYSKQHLRWERRFMSDSACLSVM